MLSLSLIQQSELATHLHMLCLVAQSCLTLCDLVDCSPPGSSVYRTLRTRVLEWVAMPSSRGSSQTREDLLHFRQILYQLPHQGSPFLHISPLFWISFLFRRYILDIKVEMSRSDSLMEETIL